MTNEKAVEILKRLFVSAVAQMLKADVLDDVDAGAAAKECADALDAGIKALEAQSTT